MEKLTWSAFEYEEKERSTDWFWALGIIVVTSAVASIIFGNYFFAALLLLGGALLGFFSVKKPEIITYELNDQGLKIRTLVYSYDRIKSFWVQNSTEGENGLEPLLFVKSERIFMPIVSIVINDDIANDVHEIFLAKNVPEEEMKEHPSIQIMERLGF
ncbi:MAG: hypothetical protein WCI76_01430 [bacterium]